VPNLVLLSQSAQFLLILELSSRTNTAFRKKAMSMKAD